MGRGREGPKWEGREGKGEVGGDRVGKGAGGSTWIFVQGQWRVYKGAEVGRRLVAPPPLSAGVA